MFNADAKIEALEPATVIFRGEVHEGQLMSAPQIEPLLRRFDQMRGGNVPFSDAIQLLRDCYEAAGLPASLVDELPMAVLPDALADFFDCQGGKTAADTTTETKSTA